MTPERLRILRELDMDAAAKVISKMPDGSAISQMGLLAGLHKARLIAPGITDQEREVSRAWLASQGMVGLNGAPLRPQ